jgi:general secretion pathway protein D
MFRSARFLFSAAFLIGVTAAASGSLADVAGVQSNSSSRRALDRSLPELRFNATPLSDVLDFLADATSSNFSVDWKELDAAHIAKDAPITMRMSASLPLHKVLSMVLDQAAGRGELTYFVDEGVIEITTQEASDKVLISRTYPIQDLLFQPTDYTNAPDLSLQSASQGQSAGGGGGGGSASNSNLFSGSTTSSNTSTAASQADRAQEIIKLITDTVKPELWQVNGGTATISFFRGNLIVNAPRSIHELLESQ